MKLYWLSISIFALLVACKPGTKDDSGDAATSGDFSLEAQLMKLHDEDMQKLTEINDLSTELRKIKSASKESEDGVLMIPDGLEQKLESMKLAEQGMWDWMKAYSDTKPTIQPDQLETFYQNELNKMKSVDQGIQTSIAKTKDWLDAYHSGHAQ